MVRGPVGDCVPSSGRGDSSTGELSPRQLWPHRQWMPSRQGGNHGSAVRALDTLQARGSLGELPSAPLVPRPHARFLEPQNGSDLGGQPGTTICTDGCAGAPASMDALGHSSRPPFSQRRPKPSPTLTRCRARTAADTGGVIKGTVEALVAPRNRTPALADAAVVGDKTPNDGDNACIGT